MASATSSPQPTRRPEVGRQLALSVLLLGLAAAGWWWSRRAATDGSSGMDGMSGMEASMSAGAFALAWLAMMAAMMLPAVLPVVRLYGLAAAQGRVAPTAWFAGGYLVVWVAVGVPAYAAWSVLEQPLADGADWVARVAGVTFLAAAVWQVSPLKLACLRHCRSPMGFLLRSGGALRRPAGALRAGATHGLVCLGCCWAMFAVLVVLGAMSLVWMAALTVLIILEKHAPHGERIAAGAAIVLAALGGLLLFDASTLNHLT